MQKKYILSVLRNTMLEFLRDPRWGLRNEEFELRSTRKWAVDEVLRWIRCTDLPPEDTIKEFIENCARCKKLNKRTKYIFETASDIAEDMLDILIALK